VRRKLLLAAKVSLAIVALMGLAFGALMTATFWGIVDPEDGQQVGVGVTIHDGYVSCHYIEAGHGTVVLIDACVDEEAEAITAALAAAGRAPADVSAILLTHGHADHRAGVHAFPNAQIYAHRDELPLLRGETRSRGPIPWMSGHAEPLEAIPVDDGEVVELGQVSARALHLPGHTPGSVAWLVGDTLFLGDAAASIDAEYVSGAPWVFTDDVDENRRTLAALPGRMDAEGLTADWLVFSHSAPLRGMERLLDFTARQGR